MDGKQAPMPYNEFFCCFFLSSMQDYTNQNAFVLLRAIGLEISTIPGSETPPGAFRCPMA